MYSGCDFYWLSHQADGTVVCLPKINAVTEPMELVKMLVHTAWHAAANEIEDEDSVTALDEEIRYGEDAARMQEEEIRSGDAARTQDEDIQTSRERARSF